MIGKYYPTLARLASSDTHETLAKSCDATVGRRRRSSRLRSSTSTPQDEGLRVEQLRFRIREVRVPRCEGRVGQIETSCTRSIPRSCSCGCTFSSRTSPTTGMRRSTSAPTTSIATTARLPTPIPWWQGGGVDRTPAAGAIIILAADHGEEFGEHGGRYHGTTLFEEQVHVPLIVKIPGLSPHVVSGPTQLIDISATILGLLDLRSRRACAEPTSARGWRCHQRRRTACRQRSPRSRTSAWSSWRGEAHLRREPRLLFYFDLRADPREQHDLVDQRPTVWPSCVYASTSGWGSRRATSPS